MELTPLSSRKHRKSAAKASAREDGSSAEVFNAPGDPIGVIPVPESALEPRRENKVCRVRTLELRGQLLRPER